MAFPIFIFIDTDILSFCIPESSNDWQVASLIATMYLNLWSLAMSSIHDHCQRIHLNIFYISVFFSTCRNACPIVPLCVYNGMMSCMFAGARFGSPLLASRQPCRCRREETYDQGGGERVSASVTFLKNQNHCIDLRNAAPFRSCEPTH